jgi:hypothetical protein
VIAHCIYGVDINPMAVELCKVNLWLEALEPGKPLTFLDAHIKCGNSLVGVGPKMDLNTYFPLPPYRGLAGCPTGIQFAVEVSKCQSRRTKLNIGQFKLALRCW